MIVGLCLVIKVVVVSWYIYISIQSKSAYAAKQVRSPLDTLWLAILIGQLYLLFIYLLFYDM